MYLNHRKRLTFNLSSEQHNDNIANQKNLIRFIFGRAGPLTRVIAKYIVGFLCPY